MSKKYPKLIGSSADPSKVSLTLKGTAVILVGLAVKQFDLPIDDTTVAQVVEALWIVGAGLTTLYGLARKIWLKVR